MEEFALNKLFSILIALIFGTIVPIGIFYILRKKGTISDSDASNKNERDLPYLIAVFLCLTAMFAVINLDLNISLIILWIVYAVISLLIYIINKYWKISAHATGAAVPLGVMIFFGSWAALIFLPIGFIVGWSRIELKLHTVSQVAAGFFLGLASSIIPFYLITHIIKNVY